LFQKNSISEPKYLGDQVKPRAISSTDVFIKSKEIRRSSNKEIKKVKMHYKSFYNLYCNYISAFFIECIKIAQSGNSQRTNEAIFCHGKNSETLMMQVNQLISEIGLPIEDLAFMSSDFSKYDAFRSEDT